MYLKLQCNNWFENIFSQYQICIVVCSKMSWMDDWVKIRMEFMQSLNMWFNLVHWFYSSLSHQIECLELLLDVMARLVEFYTFMIWLIVVWVVAFINTKYKNHHFNEFIKDLLKFDILTFVWIYYLKWEFVFFFHWKFM